MLSLKSFENEKDFWLGIQNLSLPLKNYIRFIEAKPAHFRLGVMRNLRSRRNEKLQNFELDSNKLLYRAASNLILVTC